MNVSADACLSMHAFLSLSDIPELSDPRSKLRIALGQLASLARTVEEEAQKDWDATSRAARIFPTEADIISSMASLLMDCVETGHLP
jgi:hypothetical protein